LSAEEKIGWSTPLAAWPAPEGYTDIEIRGAGGGKSSGKAHTPTEAPNTLQSSIKGRILDLIAYGPIYGLADGLKSVYLDKTPVMNADGSYNFSGIKMTTREGWPDQPPIEGFPDVESTTEINTEVLFATPVVRSISNNDADAALVTVQVAALSQQQENGDVVGYQVAVSIETRIGGGAWTPAVNDVIQGKTTSPFPVTYRIPLEGDGPFDIRVKRTAPESTTSNKQDKIVWTLLTEVIEAKLYYPNMAMVGIEIDSKLFGSSMPERSYDVKLSIVSVPTNYDPVTREYTGIWDGTFKQAWTDNPAWCFYDLATHPVIGAGLTDVDKWALYNIGQYCDQLVPDGYGGTEPRFTCNTIFADQEDAIIALNTLASVFRGMSYWGTNTMVAVADMPSAPVKIVSPANVIDGEFEYVGTSLKERHSVAVAMWNDPEDEGKAVPEVYEDPESINLYGWKETRVTAVACNSRGQARRLCKWILYSERMETQTVSYKATMDHVDVRPGDIVEVADPFQQGARMSGRVLVTGTHTLQLDKLPGAEVLALSANWWLSVLMPNGTVQRAEVSSFSGNNVTLILSLPDAPIVGAMWALSATELELPQYRVVSVTEDEKATSYEITATEYDPRKYDIVELDLHLPDRPTSTLPTGPVAPALDLSFQAYTYYAGDTRHQGLVISWTPPKDIRVDGYMLDVKSPVDGGFRTVYVGAGTSFDLKDAMGGEWVIRVRCTAQGVPGPWVSRTVQIAHLLLPVPPDSITVTLGTFSITLTPHSAYPDAIWEFWRSDVPLAANLIETNATKLPTGQYLVDTPLRAGRTYFYYVRGTNQYGVSTWFSTQGTTLEDFDDILDQVETEILEGQLYAAINEQIVTVSTDTATNVVNAAVDGLNTSVTNLSNQVSSLDSAVTDLDADVAAMQGQIDTLVDALSYDKTKAYAIGETVKGLGNRLYQAKIAVPADLSGANAPPNATYWTDIGQLLLDNAGMVTAIQLNTAEITRIDGKLTYTASKIDSLQAAYRDDDASGDLEAALEGWESKAKFNQKITVLTNADTALSERITVFQAEMDSELGSVAASLTTMETARVEADNALSQLITLLRADMNTADSAASAALATEQTARATADTAIATSVTQLTAKVNTDVGAVSASLATEQTTRATADTALSTSITQLTAKVNTDVATVTASVVSLSQTTATADTALGVRIDGVIAKVNTDVGVVAASVATETSARASADTAIAQSVTNLSASVDTKIGTVNASISSLTTSTASADTALGVRIDNLQVKMGQDIAAAVLTETNARVTAVAAEATARQTLSTDYNNNKGTVQSQINSLSAVDGSLSSQINSVSATAGANTAAIQVVSQAQASLKSGLNALYAIKLQTFVDGRTYAAGMGIDITTSGGVTQSQILFQADRFALLSTATGVATLPFFVEGNNTYITNALIKTASISNAQIADAAITYAKIAFGQIAAAHIIDAQITTAKIADAAITAAKIGALQVDTLRIADNAVTIPYYGQLGNSGARTATITYPSAVNMVIMASVSRYSKYMGGQAIVIRLWNSGGVLLASATGGFTNGTVYGGDPWLSSAPAAANFYVGPGSYYVTIESDSQSSAGVLILGAMK
jgi:predicted phage tail protein